MNKVIKLIALLSLVLVMLAGCATKDDVDKAKLNSDIDAANVLITETVIGNLAGNVTKLANGVYKGAINDAKKVADEATATQTKVDAAVKTLADATKVFKAAILTADVMDKDALKTAITTATTLKDSKTVGEANGNVPQAAMDTYAAAITAAQAVFDTATTQSAVDTAITTLATATVAFKDTVIGTDNTALTTAIATATTLKSSKTVGTAEGNVPQAAMDTYTAAITAAQAVADNAASKQSDIDVAITVLAAATTAFTDSIVKATTTETVDYLYSTAGTNAITNERADWGSGTTSSEDFTDETYSPCIKLVSGTGWGDVSCQAFTNLTAGVMTGYTTISFKIKTTDYTTIRVKVPEIEIIYTIADGKALAGGWVQMSIPLSDFADATGTAVEFAILEFGAGTMYLTDIGFAK
jgi:hypothetical protein